MLYISCVVVRQRPVGLLLSKGGHEIFYVRNGLSACCAQEGEKGTDESAQVFTRKNRKMVLHPVSTGSRTHGSCFHWLTSAAC